MPIGLIAYMNVVVGKGEEFERAFADQAEVVRAKEPGTQMYKLFKSRENENEYVIMEIYDDEDAFQAHANSQHFKDSRPRMLPLRDGKPRVAFFDAV